MQFFATPTFLIDELQGATCGSSNGWWQGRGVDVRARTLDQPVDQCGLTGNEGAKGTEGFAESPDQNRHGFLIKVLLFADPTTLCADDTEAVRIIDYKPRGFRLSELSQRSHRRDVAIHAENTVGRDQGAGLGVFASEVSECGGGCVSIIVWVAFEFTSAGEQCGVDQRRVIESILQDQIIAFGERSDHAEVRHVAGGEHHRSFAAREIGERTFKQIVLGIVSADEMRCTRADRAATCRVDHRRTHRGMCP